MTNLLAIAVVTAYCSCSSCCGCWSGGPTASGIMPIEGVTVAANHLPFGTRVHIEGLGWRTVQDRMSRKYTGRLDIYFNSHGAARRFGKQRLLVSVPSVKSVIPLCPAHNTKGKPLARRIENSISPVGMARSESGRNAEATRKVESKPKAAPGTLHHP